MLDALIEAIIAGRLTHRQARIALAVATGGQMGARRLEAVTGIDRADCKKVLQELVELGWLVRGEGGAMPAVEGGDSPPGGQITPRGGVKHPPGGKTPPALKPAPVGAFGGRGVNHPPLCSGGSSYTNTTTTTTTAPEQIVLVFPKCFTPDQQAVARRMLAPLNGQAQDLLDEIAGREAIHPIKNPLAYLRGLVQRAKAGNFTPEAGVAVAEARRRHEALQRARKEAEDAHLAEIKRSAPLAEFKRSVPPGGSLKAALEALRRSKATA